MFSVNEIISHINGNYLAKPHLYKVNIFGRTQADDASRSIVMNCSSVIVPGSNLQITQEKRYGIGLNYNVVQQKQYAEVVMTFYESEFEPERKYFSDWINKIIDPVTFRLKYYRDYVRDIQILQYNNKEELVYEAMLRECMPGNISGLERGYDKSETVPQFSVNIQFQDIEEQFYQRNT